jgi:chitinase
MKTKRVIFSWAIALLLSWLSSFSYAQFRVVGYAASWAPTTIQYSKLTHINYSFALPQYGGRLKPIDNPSYLRSIVSNAHAHGTKVFIAIGGWSDNNVPLDPVFESIAADPGSRTNFINDALAMVATYNLDGVDMDWEYPDPGTSANNFVILMRDLSNALKARGKGLSFAGPSDSYSAGGISSAVFQYVDFVNIMSYDGGGAHHSTYQFAVDGLNLYKSKGCPANKCVVGVPFYARPSWRSYNQLLAAGASPNSDWFGNEAYNGIPTIKQKTQMALQQAGGIMMWELSQDAQGANSLLSAIHDVVRTNNNNNNNNGVTNLSGAYRLQNRYSGLYMDVNAAETHDGAKVQQWSNTNCTCQNFVFNHLGNGVYRITAQHSNKSLDVSGNSSTDGAKIHQWNTHGRANQQFKVVATGDGFYKIFAQNSGKLVEVGSWSNSNGGVIQQWADNGQSSGQWRLVPVGSSNFTRTIEAENFNNMLGVQNEPTTDAGGGQNVGYIDNNDWMAYNSINFPTTGNYRVEYRVASVGGGRLSLDLNAGTIPLGAVNIPNTGGWQNWTTVSHTVHINAGTYNVGIFAQAGGWNINWFRFTKVNGARAALEPFAVEGINSSDYSLQSSVTVFPNPVADALRIEAAFDLSNTQLSIIDLTGTEVFRSSGIESSIDVSALPSGIYTAILDQEGNKVYKRFIKQ